MDRLTALYTKFLLLEERHFMGPLRSAVSPLRRKFPEADTAFFWFVAFVGFSLQMHMADPRGWYWWAVIPLAGIFRPRRKRTKPLKSQNEFWGAVFWTYLVLFLPMILLRAEAGTSEVMILQPIGWILMVLGIRIVPVKPEPAS